MYYKNSNDQIAKATVIPTPHTYNPQTKQFPSTNINHKKEKKSRLHNNGQNTKNIPTDQVLQSTEPVKYINRSPHENKTKTALPSKIFTINPPGGTTKQKNIFSFFSSNTVAIRSDHVDNPTYADHTVTTTKQPEATDDPT